MSKIVKKALQEINSILKAIVYPANSADEDFYLVMLKKVVNGYKIGGVLLMCLSFVLLLINLFPGLTYYIYPDAINNDAKTIISTVSAEELTKLNKHRLTLSDVASTGNTSGDYAKAVSLPAINYSLPTATTLQIPKIGINGSINKGDDGLSTMDKGIWLQSYNDDPKNEGALLLASHRYGLLSWSSAYREHNSFYRLPELRPGDEIYYVHGQRQYSYKVKAVYEDNKLEAVDADLILYTCKFFGSKERIIVLADATW
jgi:sortase (surface protein transpeptidase)